MNKLQPLICKGCGGHIDRDTLTCKSCGTAYKYDSDGRLITVEQFDRKTVYINGAIAVPAFIVNQDPQMAMEMTLNEIANVMVKKIMPLIEFQTRFEPRTMEYITHARIGVAEPFEYIHYVKAQFHTPDEFFTDIRR